MVSIPDVRPVTPSPSAALSPARPRSSLKISPAAADGTARTGSDAGAAPMQIMSPGGMSAFTGGDGGTHADEKSQGSGTTATSKMLLRLRRSFFDTNKPLLPGLYYLRLVGLLVTVLAIALSVAIAFLTVSSFKSYSSNVNYVTQGAERMLRLFNAVVNVQDLHFAAKGWVPLRANASGSTLPDEMALRQYARQNMTEFLMLHRSMYSTIQQTTASSTYTRPYVMSILFDQPDAPPSGAQVVTNLFEAGVMVAKQIGQAAASPFVSLANDSQPYVAFTFINSLPGGVPHETLHASLEYGFTLSEQSAASVQQQQVWIYGIMMVVLAIIAFAIFLPILTKIEAAKDAIAVKFLELPILVRRALYQQALKRFKTIRRSYVTDDDEEDGDTDATSSGDEKQGPTLIEDTFGNAEMGNDQGSIEGDIDWTRLLRTAGTSASTPGASRRGHASSMSTKSSKASSRPSKPRKTYSKSAWSFLILIGQFIGPLLALAAFFTCIFAMSTIYLKRLTILASIAAAATSRASCSRELIMDVQRLMSVNADRSYMANTFGFVVDTADCIQYWQRLMQYGADSVQDAEVRAEYARVLPVVETGTSPYLSTDGNAAVYDLMFTNACPYLAQALGSGFDLARCQAFGSGILTQGLQAGVLEYTRRVSMLAHQRMRMRTVINDTAWHAFLLPESSYNYSADSCGDKCMDVQMYEDNTHIIGPPPLPDPDYEGDVPPDFLVSGAAPAGTVPTTFSEMFQSEDVKFLRDADALYITPALYTLAQYYSSNTADTVNFIIFFEYVFVATFLSAFVLFMVLAYWPQIHRTQAEISTKRSVLLYLPPEVVAHVKAIRKLVQEILSAEGDSLGRLPISSSPVPSRASEAIPTHNLTSDDEAHPEDGSNVIAQQSQALSMVTGVSQSSRESAPPAPASTA